MHIPLNLGDVKERAPVAHAKYDLTILEVDTEARTKEGGKPQWILNISIGGHEMTAPNIKHYVGIPSDKDTAEQAQFKKLQIARLLSAFGLPMDGLDSDALIGATANLEVTKSEPDDQGRVFNRMVLPYLKEAGAGVAKPPSTAGKKR